MWLLKPCVLSSRGGALAFDGPEDAATNAAGLSGGGAGAGGAGVCAGAGFLCLSGVFLPHFLSQPNIAAAPTRVTGSISRQNASSAR